MKISPIIVRLRAEAGTAARFSSRVAGAADFAALADTARKFTVPHAFVVFLTEEVEEDQTAGLVSQAIREVFGIIVAVANDDARGQDACDELSDIRDELWTALLGWSPDATELPGLEYEGSVQLDISRARVWHQFNFSTLRMIQQT